jgi:hypothetical protein
MWADCGSPRAVNGWFAGNEEEMIHRGLFELVAAGRAYCLLLLTSPFLFITMLLDRIFAPHVRPLQSIILLSFSTTVSWANTSPTWCGSIVAFQSGNLYSSTCCVCSAAGNRTCDLSKFVKQAGTAVQLRSFTDNRQDNGQRERERALRIPWAVTRINLSASLVEQNTKANYDDWSVHGVHSMMKRTSDDHKPGR